MGSQPDRTVAEDVNECGTIGEGPVRRWGLWRVSTTGMWTWDTAPTNNAEERESRWRNISEWWGR